MTDAFCFPQMIVLVVAIPVISITVISAVSARSSITDQTIDINNAQAEIIKQSVTAIIEQNFRAMEAVADSPATIAYLSGDAADNGTAENIIMQLQRTDENLNDGNTTVITGRMACRGFVPQGI